MNADDPYFFRRFLRAQEQKYSTALRELRNGAKYSHWIWYIFPQVAGLGRSQMSKDFAIKSKSEVIAYLEHPVLGARLLECTQALLLHKEKSIEEVMGGYTDARKLRSSMTLFGVLSDPYSAFSEVLFTFYDGREDGRTLQFLDENP